jgi:NADH:ubiquinone oxidoreductase subunit F (NADH-binding)
MVEDMVVMVEDMAVMVEDMVVAAAAVRCHISARYCFVHHKAMAIL